MRAERAAVALFSREVVILPNGTRPVRTSKTPPPESGNPGRRLTVPCPILSACSDSAASLTHSDRRRR